MNKLKVLQLNRITKDIYEIELERNGYSYTSGNCASIFGEDGQTSRMYSFSSDDRDESKVSFLIKRFPNGYVSEYLTSRQVGDEIKISNPFGWFKPGTKQNSVFIATGVGISPFLSAARSGLLPPDFLYFGCRSFMEDYPYPIIAKFETRYPYSTKIKCCLSRNRIWGDPNDNTSALGTPASFYNERVTDSLRCDFGSGMLNMGYNYYLCGNDSMIEEVTKILADNNVPEENIFAEKFFNK